MRTIILIFLFTHSLFAFSQEPGLYMDFPKGNFYLFKGAKLIVNEENSYNTLNKVFNTLNDAKYKKVAYPKNSVETDKDSLKKLDIIVEDFVNIDGDKIDQNYTGDVYFKCITNKGIMFIKYFPTNKFNFPFNAIPSEENKKLIRDRYINRYKNSLSYSKDDFTLEKTIETPYELDPIGKENHFYGSKYTKVHFSKTKSKSGITSIYIQLDASSMRYDILKKGVIILFTDGSRLTKPNVNIDVDPGSGAFWNYYALFKLTQEEINMFSNKKLSKYRLYQHDEEVSSEDADHLREYLKEIVKYKL